MEDIAMDIFMQIVNEEFSLAQERIHDRITRIRNVGNQGALPNRMRLEFRNKVPDLILTGDVIMGEGDTRVHVVLVDDTTGNVIDVAPYASARVEIVVLKGDFDASGGNHDSTVKQFNGNIVPETREKKPFLRGNVLLKLQGGVAVLEDIRFRNHVSKIIPPVFRLGARVVDTFGGIHILEAMTESFTVKIYRGKYSRKHKIPAPSDDVYRLINIGKGGNIHKLLKENGIRTVEHFLIRHLIDPEELKRVVVTLGEKKLEATIKHAQACPIVERMYCYKQGGTAIVFNLSGQVLGIYCQSQDSLNVIDILAETNEADVQDLLASAYKHWKDTFYCVDDASVRRHLTSVLLPNPPSSGLHNNMGTSNIATGECESSNTCMESMFTAESTGDGRQTVLGTTVDGTVTNIGATFVAFGAPMQNQSLLDQQNIYSPNLQYDYFWFDNPCLNEDLAAGEAVFANNNIPKAPKRWKRLFCVSRFSFRVKKKMQNV